MKLFTNEIKEKSKKVPIGTYSDIDSYSKMLNCKVLLKIFHPIGRFTYYILESDDLTDDSNEYQTFYGYCLSPLNPNFDELGYEYVFNLIHETIYGLHYERDISIEPFQYTLKECLERDSITNTPILRY